MERNNNSAFEYGRKIVKYLLIASLLAAGASLFFFKDNVSAQYTLMGLTLVMFLGIFYFMARYCKCPRCGRTIILGVLAVTSCPHCHRNLETGRKTKKK